MPKAGDGIGLARLRRRRTALALYGLLLVLPTAALGALHWRQLTTDHRERLADVPWEVYDAGRRLAEAVHDELHPLVEGEDRRPWYQYRETFFPPGTIGTEFALMRSPLAYDPAPTGILAWFSYEFSDGALAPVTLFGGAGDPEEWERDHPALLATAADLVLHDQHGAALQRRTHFPGARETRLSLSVAAINHSAETDVECMLDELAHLRTLETSEIDIHQYGFHLRFFLEADGTPRLIATRRVLLTGSPLLDEMPDCFSTLRDGAYLVQGFFIDPDWLFEEVPSAAATRVLDGSQRFLPASSDLPAPATGEETECIHLVKELGFDTYTDEDRAFGALHVAVNTTDLERRFAEQERRFLGVAAMLGLSLVTGLVLLLRSVRRDLEYAHQTENFVAAVTHELRTPVSAIRLYGEMLRDGWARDPERQADYHRRIVAEAERLETMVERVLEKGQLAGAPSEPEAADLNATLEPVLEGLLAEREGAAQDLAVRLDDGLPPVMLTAEAVGSIVCNLVENARKYASAAENPTGEPILVRTRMRRGRVVLEVCDRGPGIPAEQRERVFEAFQRMGNEATRTSRGAGLGLHLVRTQAEALGGSAEVVDRPGEGSVFRVQFRLARTGR
ncbi:MAG: HAMP domain-containing sensor histidine kinase [Planctomycetota bacterium]|jgi:signal transduction histidine kinase|nr:HAMP domain-containing sensor histidine kinase [Planctomycetota bacterium]MDP6763439.1 HAMP domain-containing sensor histidine kinase [Planctomycetota bacterium]MDP6989611.1 HAMP domain-containing sensor histidine kinase [Planctomycetota bacterium]